MMKRKISLALAMMLVLLSLTACGGSSNGASSSDEDSSSSAVIGGADGSTSIIVDDGTQSGELEDAPDPIPEPQPTEDETTGSTSKPSTGTTSKPSGGNTTKPSTGNTSKPSGGSTSKPSTGNTSKPSGGSSSGATSTPKPDASTPAKSPAVSDLVTAVEGALGELPALMELTADDIKNNYGINSSDLVEFSCKMPMMSTHATEYFIAKVASGKMDTVKAGAQSRQAALDSAWKQYLPDQYELVQNYKLVTNGDYILFIVAENADAAVTAFNNSTK